MSGGAVDLVGARIIGYKFTYKIFFLSLLYEWNYAKEIVFVTSKYYHYLILNKTSSFLHLTLLHFFNYPKLTSHRTPFLGTSGLNITKISHIPDKFITYTSNLLFLESRIMQIIVEYVVPSGRRHARQGDAQEQYRAGDWPWMSLQSMRHIISSATCNSSSSISGMYHRRRRRSSARCRSWPICSRIRRSSVYLGRTR